MFPPDAQPSLAATPHLLEVSHVAHRLSLSEDFVRRLLRKKKLTAIRIGKRWRVDPVDLQAFIDRHRHSPRGRDLKS